VSGGEGVSMSFGQNDQEMISTGGEFYFDRIHGIAQKRSKRAEFLRGESDEFRYIFRRHVFSVLVWGYIRNRPEPRLIEITEIGD